MHRPVWFASWLALAATASIASSIAPAVAAPATQRIAVPTPVEAFVQPPPHEGVRVLYLERCRGGCVVTKGTMNDASTMTSTIPDRPGQSVIGEFRNSAGAVGAAADAEWAAFVTCMQEVYSPFAVTVTDVRPTEPADHVAIVAGSPVDIGLSTDILGVAPLASNCSPQRNALSFSFANAHGPTDRVHNVCWTAAQESAHAFGLDHQWAFVSDNRSACNDPMTYRNDCGGQKFFRNAVASCGEHNPRDCRCGKYQNSHDKLLTVFGEGRSTIPNPTINLLLPLPTSETLGEQVAARAHSRRGIARVELHLNGFKWAEVRGVAFTGQGQPEAAYQIPVPSGVPDSIIDVKMRAFDDLGNSTDSEVVTVTKGPAGGCTTADTCLEGQKCDLGRCAWDPPTGELGEPCRYAQFCKSGLCRGTSEETICTRECVPGAQSGACPDGFACVETAVGQGVCFPPVEGGCCSVARAASGPWGHAGFAALVLAIAVRPRRRHRSLGSRPVSDGERAGMRP
ncbi:MAG: MYXO-CTERM sorting domain-containing protein [Kofleriaceae bacterium]